MKKQNHDASERSFCKALEYQAYNLREEGKYQEALSILLDLVDQGYAKSFLAMEIALLYELIEGLEKAFQKSLYWYKKAARMPDALSSACDNTAILYSRMGNRRRAFFWWDKAIKLGDGDAALERAKFMLKSKRWDTKKVSVLLKTALRSSNITLEALEEAKELLGTIVTRV